MERWQVMKGTECDTLVQLVGDELVPMATGRREVVVPLAAKLNQIEGREVAPTV